MIEYVSNYQRKWSEHVNRMNAGRIRKQILCCEPRG